MRRCRQRSDEQVRRPSRRVGKREGDESAPSSTPCTARPQGLRSSNEPLLHEAEVEVRAQLPRLLAEGEESLDTVGVCVKGASLGQRVSGVERERDTVCTFGTSLASFDDEAPWVEVRKPDRSRGCKVRRALATWPARAGVLLERLPAEGLPAPPGSRGLSRLNTRGRSSNGPVPGRGRGPGPH